MDGSYDRKIKLKTARTKAVARSSLEAERPGHTEVLAGGSESWTRPSGGGERYWLAVLRGETLGGREGRGLPNKIQGTSYM